MSFPDRYKDASVKTKEGDGKFEIEMSRMSDLDADRRMNTVASCSYFAGAEKIIEKNLEEWLELIYKQLLDREKTIRENW